MVFCHSEGRSIIIGISTFTNWRRGYTCLILWFLLFINSSSFLFWTLYQISPITSVNLTLFIFWFFFNEILYSLLSILCDQAKQRPTDWVVSNRSMFIEQYICFLFKNSFNAFYLSNFLIITEIPIIIKAFHIAIIMTSFDAKTSVNYHSWKIVPTLIISL
jgi:hypothetical protein